MGSLLTLPAEAARKRGRHGASSLDQCDTLYALVIKPESGTIRLTWWAAPGVEEWVIYRSLEADPATATIAAVVHDANTWLEADTFVTAHSRAFYYLTGRWVQGTPENYAVIEDFEGAIELESYSAAEDRAPNAWAIDTDHASGATGHSLELNGNTWKRQPIDTVSLLAGTVWRVIIKGMTPGDNQAFGLADSANELWYPLWGSEMRRSNAWSVTYQGWFATNTWVSVDLPVGDDFKARYGYYPEIVSLLYSNDNDGAHAAGVMRVDEIRDATGTVSLPPIARFRWQITGYPAADTMEVTFCSMGCDPEGPLYQQQWSFGDGTISFEANPVHRYASQGAYSVSLSITDTAERVDWIVQQVRDTAFTVDRRITMLFSGDVMMARRYETGGIIPNQGVNAIFAKVQPLVSSVDLAMCNLECPLTTYTTHHPTKSIYFKSRPEYVGALAFAGFDYVALANNHNMDYMEPGMNQTKHVLDSVLILANGAGSNDEIARQPVFYTKDGMCVAVLSFCNRDGSWDNEQPFLGAAPGRPGFAMWDRRNIELAVPAARAVADIVIVQSHTGTEYSLEPALRARLGIEDEEEPLQAYAYDLLPDTADAVLQRYAIDLGADVVVNHHPHVVQGFEAYQGKLIAHSMGNFAFDQEYSETFVSMAVTGTLSNPGGASGYAVHPIYINRYIPTPATGKLGTSILDYLSAMSTGFQTWLVRSSGADSAIIVLNNENAQRFGAPRNAVLPLEDRDGFAVSAPYFVGWNGYLAQMSVQGGEEFFYRLGHDALWFGSMEGEGATPWDLNSAYEKYDSSDSNSGIRSIRLNRAGGGSNSVSTNLLYRQPCKASSDYSIMGWVSGSNTLDEYFQMETYAARSGSAALDIFVPGGARAGTYNWTRYWINGTARAGVYWFGVKMNLHAPASGEGLAWFDDLDVVEWDPWQSAPAAVTFPGNLRYVQVRAPTGTSNATINFQMDSVIVVAEADVQPIDNHAVGR